MTTRPFSTASDVTIIDVTDAQANELQAELTSNTEFAKPSISQLRIFVYDKTGPNATRLDRSGTEDKTGRASAFYDTMKKALLMTVGVYLSKKGTKTLKDMADIWIKANMKKPNSTAVDAAVKAWQKELRAGNLPPLVVSWEEKIDGHTFAPGKPPSSLRGTDQSLESMTITLNGPVCRKLYLTSLPIFRHKIVSGSRSCLLTRTNRNAGSPTGKAKPTPRSTLWSLAYDSSGYWQ